MIRLSVKSKRLNNEEEGRVLKFLYKYSTIIMTENILDIIWDVDGLIEAIESSKQEKAIEYETKYNELIGKICYKNCDTNAYAKIAIEPMILENYTREDIEKYVEKLNRRMKNCKYTCRDIEIPPCDDYIYSYFLFHKKYIGCTRKILYRLSDTIKNTLLEQAPLRWYTMLNGLGAYGTTFFDDDYKGIAMYNSDAEIELLLTEEQFEEFKKLNVPYKIEEADEYKAYYYPN